MPADDEPLFGFWILESKAIALASFVVLVTISILVSILKFLSGKDVR